MEKEYTEMKKSEEEKEIEKLENNMNETEPKIITKIEDEPADIKNLYVSVFAYNMFTITDGAVRMIILLWATELGFSAWEIAVMFTLYEVAGVFTNLFAGVLGQQFGLKCTLIAACVLQIIGLILLVIINPVFGGTIEAATLTPELRSSITIYVTFCAALTGVAKDFMKLTGKAVPKLVTKDGNEDALFKIVAWLTGAKNALKGFGFFLGSLLLFFAGYEWSIIILMVFIILIVPPSIKYMENWLGRSPKGQRPKFISIEVFKKGWNVNILSLARAFLFGSRDVWFEIGCPIFLKQVLLWEDFSVGAFLAGYIIIYGNLQAYTTKMYKTPKEGQENKRAICFSALPTKKDVPLWAFITGVEVLVVGIALYFAYINYDITTGEGSVALATTLIVGLAIFSGCFAVNSAVHSYLIVSYSGRDKVAMSLGFYYMGNAMGRLVGTLLGGALYTLTVEDYGLSVCLWTACFMLFASSFVAGFLRDEEVKADVKNINKPDVQNIDSIKNTESFDKIAAV